MPEEPKIDDPVELTQRLIDAGNRRDVDAAMSIFAPDVVWESLDGLPAFEGASAVRGFLSDWLSSYEVFHIDLEEALDMGGGIAFAVGGQGGRLLGAAGRVEGRSAWAITWEHGLATHMIASSMHIDAVRAAAERLAEERRSVSQEAVDLVYRLVDALNARQAPGFLAPDVRVETPETAVTGGVLVGEHGWREWMSEFFGAFAEDARLQVDEIIAARADCVAAVISLVGRGAVSEAPLRLRWANVWWFRDGQLLRAAGFLHRREALKAAGLEE